MSKPQLTERKKLERDLRELIALRSLPVWSDEWHAELERIVLSKTQLSKAELEQRQRRWVKIGSPALDSPEWQAELKRLRRARNGAKRLTPPSTINTNPDDLNSEYWRVLLLAARQAQGERVEPLTVPGQRVEGQTKKQQAEARRMYRWLWRHAPGLLRACDDELRELIRRAGGIA